MTDFNVVAELAAKLTPIRAAAWMTDFEPYAPAVSRSPRGRSEIVITVPAKSFEQAVTTGLALLARSATADLVTFTVMTTAEYDRRAEDVALPALVGATEAAEIIGITRQRVQQLARDGALSAVKVGNALAFPRAQVEARAASRRGEGATVDATDIDDITLT